MDDGEFLRLFHDGNLSGEEFRHRGHLRLAWLVLSKHSRIEAESMVAREIRRFAVANGASNRYHDTLTRFWVRVMQFGPFLIVTRRAPATSLAVRCPELAYGTIRSASP